MKLDFVPSPTPVTQPFWDSTRVHQMAIQHCLSCGKPFFYPRAYCPFCHSSKLEWRAVSGRATLVSYIINRRPAPAFGDDPQIIALIDLEEGPRMMTNIVDVEADPRALRIGMALRVSYHARGDQVLPMFAPDAEQAR